MYRVARHDASTTRVLWENIPGAMRAVVQWVCWHYEMRNDKMTKVPLNPHTGHAASSTNPATWASFTAAMTFATAHPDVGIGFVLGRGWIGVDLDHVVEPTTGDIQAEAMARITRLDSYTEISPSGTGIHVMARGSLPPGRRKRGPVEMYEAARFFTVTGQHVAPTPRTVNERTAELAALHAVVFGESPVIPRAPLTPVPQRLIVDDAEVIERAARARNGARFAALWRGDTSAHGSDDSAADLALCGALAFWCGPDTDRIDRLFRQSGLYRPKWDERRGAMTYGERTIAVVLSRPRNHYGGSVRIVETQCPRSFTLGHGRRRTFIDGGAL